MIRGLGIDVVELSRMASSWERFGERLAKRLLRPEEMNAMRAPEARYLASRFAMKEAAVKALGTGFAEGITPMDIAVRSLPSGQPELLFFGAAAQRCRTLGAVRIHASLTHGRETVAAVVILEG
jgi:holo-[acyl-carrier protein] synthase